MWVSWVGDVHVHGQNKNGRFSAKSVMNGARGEMSSMNFGTIGYMVFVSFDDPSRLLCEVCRRVLQAGYPCLIEFMFAWHLAAVGCGCLGIGAEVQGLGRQECSRSVRLQSQWKDTGTVERYATGVSTSGAG